MNRFSLSSLALTAVLPLTVGAASGGCSSSRATGAKSTTATAHAALTGGETVVWKNVTNATASGGTITKTGGQPQMEDAGGTSQQAIVSGDGAFEFTVPETSTFRFAGLTTAAGWVGGAGIDFEFRMQAGHADIYEDNVYQTDNLVNTGDVLTIQVHAGVVTYLKNGAVVFTSAKAPSYPLVADASLIDTNASIASAQISGASGYNVDWANVVNATANGSTITKTGGEQGMEDSGGTSSEQIASGDGFVQFTMSEASTFRFLGITHSPTWVGGASLDYEFRMQAGHADVYERGSYIMDNLANAGDVLSIQFTGGVASYYKNGALLYTSSIPVSYPLVADASLIDSNATVAHVVVSKPGTSGGGSDAGTDSGNPPPQGHKFAGWLMADANETPDTDVNYQDFYDHQSYFDEVNPTWWSVPYSGANENCCTDNTQPFCATYGNPAAKSICAPTQFFTKRGTTKVVPMFSNDPDPGAVLATQQMIASPTNAINWIVNQVTTGNYDGVNIDFEHLCDTVNWGTLCASRTNLTSFMTTLASRLHALSPSRSLSIAIDGMTVDDPSIEWDVAALSQGGVDGFYVMGYDFHGVGGTTGPEEPLGWMQQSIDFLVSKVGAANATKIVWGLPNYGLYSDTYNGNATDYAPLAQMISDFPGYSETSPYPTDQGYTVGLIGNGSNPNNGAGHTYGFFDDVASLNQKVQTAAGKGIGGVTYWTIGGEANAPAGQSFFDMVRTWFPKQ